MELIKSWLDYFVRNDMNMFFSLLAGCVMMGYKLPKKHLFPVRMALACLAFFAVTTGIHEGQPALQALFSRMTAEPVRLMGISKYLVIFAVSILLVSFCLRCRFYTALFCITVSYCMEHISQRIYDIIRHLLPDAEGFMSGPVFPQGMLLLAVSVLVFGLSYVLLIRHFDGKEEESQQEQGLLVFLAFLVVLADIVLSMTVMGIAISSGSRLLFISCHLFSVLVSLLALVVSMCQIRVSAASREAETLKHLLNLERLKYAQDKATADAINIKCHDLKHQLSAIKGRIDQEEYRELKHLVDLYDSSFRTYNEALDVVMQNKGLICQQKGISLSCMADGKQLDFMKEGDIYSLFSNILDNAIEAVERLQQEEKVITFSVVARQGFVFVHQDNFYNGSLQFEEGLPRTTKEDNGYHGFGTRSIRALTEKYGGDLQIDTEGGVYSLDIMLPIPEAG